MGLSETTRKGVEQKLSGFCAERVPANLSDRIRVGFRFRGNSVTLYEEKRSFFQPKRWIDIVVAQFRYHPVSRKWTLFCADRNSRWHKYLDTDPTPDFDALLKEVDEDPTGIFWG